MEGIGIQIFTILSALFAIIVTVFLSKGIMKRKEGTPEMIEIAQAIRVGAKAYLVRQYKGVSIFFAIVFVLLLILTKLGYMSIFVPFAFIVGGFFSALSGYIGMTIATNSSARTTSAAKNSINEALQVAFSSGLVMGLIVVGLALLFIGVGYSLVRWTYQTDINQIASIMVCFGMGASAQALFARVGGGIFTKGADVGADLVGKVESGIPEDDPRNPAVIADNVGDNVGDIAGMGADLYESYVGSILATMALAVTAGLGWKGISLPLAISALGILASVVGSFFVRVKEDATQANLLMALRKGLYGASIIVIIASYFAIATILPDYKRLFGSLICGVVAGLLIGFFTEYYTSDEYPPTKNVAKSSLTGHATVIIEGLATGMASTAIPVIIIVLATIGAFLSAGGFYNTEIGLYGIGLAGVGIVSTL